MKYWYIITCLMLFSGLSYAQGHGHHCGTDTRMKQALANDAGYADRLEAGDEASRNYISPAGKSNSCPKYIPVVIHILHNNGPENIADNQVNSQMTALNEDFRKTPGSNGDGNGADAMFEFYLAQKDPNGNSTTGINREQNNCTFGGSETCVKTTQWDPDKYLNVWVVDYIGSGSDAYTYLPGVTPSLDGIVIRHGVFGTTGTAAPPRQYGHTLTHEVGHYLGLYHTFNNGCSGTSDTNCPYFGDKVCDTPPVAYATWNCPASANTCTETPTDMPDLVDNYMDYTDDACRSMFTAGQRDRMHAQTEQFRANIYSQSNLDATGFPGTCTVSDGPEAENREPEIVTYPNPAKETLYIKINHLPLTSYNLQLYNAYGKLIMEKPHFQISISSNLQIDDLPPGVYFLRLAQNKYTFTGKIIISK